MSGHNGERFGLTVITAFDAAHRIAMAGSLCERLHGHRWKLETTFEGDLGEGGVVRDFIELEREVRGRVINFLDHTDLNERFENPTTEIICRWVWEQLPGMGLSEIRLWESPAYCVTYRGPRESPPEQ